MSAIGARGFCLAAGLLFAAALGAQATEDTKEPPGAKMIFLNPATGGLVSSDPGGGGTKPKPPPRSRPLSNNANPQPKAKPPRPHVTVTETPAQIAAAPVNLGLRYWIDLMDSAGDHHEVTRDRVFHSSERIQLRFQSNMTGYIALYQITSSGKVALLFPDRDRKLENRIDRDHSRALPRDDSWFRFDQTPGTERLFVLFARATEELDLLLAQRLLDHGPGALPPGDQIASKDLVLEMAPDATYAVNPAGAPIELEIALRHE